MGGIGLLSDSHGDLSAFDAAFELLRSLGARRFIFIGGRFDDFDQWRTWKQQAPGGLSLDELAKLGDRFLRTPERDCPAYADAAIAKKAMDMLGDVLCCVVHDKNDLTRDDMLNAAVFVHGRELEPKVTQIGPRFFVTPGSLNAPIASCGLLETAEKNLKFSAYALDGRSLIDGHLLSVGLKTKLSVK